MKKIFIILSSAICLLTACNTGNNTANNTDSAASSSNSSKEAKEERNKQVALANMQGFNNHNADEVMKDADADFIDYGDGSMAPIKGIDSGRAMLKTVLNAFPDIKGENIMAFADGDYVAVVGDWSGTFKNGMMGMKPTGKSFKLKDVDIFKFNDAGKIIEHRSIQSSAAMMMQLGAKMK